MQNSKRGKVPKWGIPFWRLLPRSLPSCCYFQENWTKRIIHEAPTTHNVPPLTLHSSSSVWNLGSLTDSPLRLIKGDDKSTRIVVPSSEHASCGCNSGGDSRGRAVFLDRMNHFYLARKAAGGCVCLFTHLRPAQNGQQDGDLLEAALRKTDFILSEHTDTFVPSSNGGRSSLMCILAKNWIYYMYAVWLFQFLRRDRRLFLIRKHLNPPLWENVAFLIRRALARY